MTRSTYRDLPAVLMCEPDEIDELEADCLDDLVEVEIEERPLPRATGPGWCREGYDWHEGPLE